MKTFYKIRTIKRKPFILFLNYFAYIKLVFLSLLLVSDVFRATSIDTSMENKIDSVFITWILNI